MRAGAQFAVGGTCVLQIIEVEVPRPVHGQVLIKTGAIAVNRVGAQIRAGEFALIGEPSFTLGRDVASTVDAVGPGVTGFHPGDQVMGMLAMPGTGNTYAEIRDGLGG